MVPVMIEDQLVIGCVCALPVDSPPGILPQCFVIS